MPNDQGGFCHRGAESGAVAGFYFHLLHTDSGAVSGVGAKPKYTLPKAPASFVSVPWLRCPCELQ